MNKNKSILKNYFYNLIKTIGTILFPIITFTYSARILGVEGVGQVNFVKSVIAYFTMMAMLGMNYYATREAAKIRDDKKKLSKFVQEMLVINGITTLLAYILLFLAIGFVPKFQNYEQLLYVNSIAILLQGMGMEWLYQALEEYKYIAVRTVVFQLIALVLMFLYVKTPADVVGYSAISLLATSGAYVLNFVNVRKYICLKRFSQYKIRKHVKPLLWLFFMALSIELYTVLDTTMLGFIQGDEAVGRYTAAVKINKLVNTLIASLGVVLIPRLSYYIGNGQKDKVNELVYKSYNFVFILSIPAAVGLFILSEEIMLLFSGSEFLSAGITMQILTPIVIVIPFSVVTNQQTFVPMGKENLILISTMAGAITNFICNLVLIPILAENGAAIATVIAECAVAIVCFCNANRYFNMKEVFKDYYKYWIAVLFIMVIGYIGKQIEMHYLVRIVVVTGLSACCYFGILFILKNTYLSEICKMITYKLKKQMAKFVRGNTNETINKSRTDNSNIKT